MMQAKYSEIRDWPVDYIPSEEELLHLAMRWHFSPDTGSAYWLKRARTLDFDPVRDIRSFADLRKFPNVCDELRDVPVEDLIPRGIKLTDVLGIFESGGTTGAPKRVVCTHDWMQRWLSWNTPELEKRGLPRGANWLGLMPSGPHIFGAGLREQASRCGGILFTIDMDPRWVKKLIGAGRTQESGEYAEHLIDQAADILRSQKVGVLVTTPPLLVKLARREELVKLIRKHVKFIQWGGAHMDADTRNLFQTEIFPGIALCGGYGSTMVLGGTVERTGNASDKRCVFDPFSPYISFSVIDAKTGANVAYGERGQVVMHHVSASMLLVNNLERDLATRVEPPKGQMGDSVADISPVASFKDHAVIEGVY